MSPRKKSKAPKRTMFEANREIAALRKNVRDLDADYGRLVKAHNGAQEENATLRAALHDLWEWQRNVQEVVPDELCERIQALLPTTVVGVGPTIRDAALEEAAKLADNPYGEAVAALGTFEPMATGAAIAKAIRALKRSDS